VVADLWMPGISGVQLCRLLRAEPATENVPVVLRGPDGQRNRFWAERAGAAAYVVKGHMGDLVRTLSRAVTTSPASDDFFTDLGHADTDIRDRIASYLDNALFESVIASEVRNLSLCGAFDRLFDLLSQFVCQVASYRWMAVVTETPARLGLHTHPSRVSQAREEAIRALKLNPDIHTIIVEDDDAYDDPTGREPMVQPVTFADVRIGQMGFAGRQALGDQEEQIVSIISSELGGPIRMATLVEEAQRLATIDPLTGLMNRRAFLNALDIEIERSMRLDTPLALMLMDVDHFKAINDNRGHASGDTVLAAIGRLIVKQARRVDLVARWGGEEFVVALVGADAVTGLTAAERYREAVQRLSVLDHTGDPIPVTASFGLAVLESGESIESVIDRADRAMYAGKTAGRNCVRVSPVTNRTYGQHAAAAAAG
jgi:two-component system cell cycle response regulator